MLLGMNDPSKRADGVMMKVSGGDASRDSDYGAGLKMEMKKMAFGEFIQAVKSDNISRAMEAFGVYQKLCDYDKED